MALLRSSYDEKRSFIRMRVDAPVTMALMDSGEELEGLCRDLSGNGFLLELDKSLPVGTRMEISIKSNHSHSPILHAYAIVKRVTSESGHANKPCLLGMAIENVLT